MDTKFDYVATDKLRFSGRWGYQPFLQSSATDLRPVLRRKRRLSDVGCRQLPATRRHARGIGIRNLHCKSDVPGRRHFWHHASAPIALPNVHRSEGWGGLRNPRREHRSPSLGRRTPELCLHQYYFRYVWLLVSCSRVQRPDLRIYGQRNQDREIPHGALWLRYRPSASESH